jgi:hypothetical protein
LDADAPELLDPDGHDAQTSPASLKVPSTHTVQLATNDELAADSVPAAQLAAPPALPRAAPPAQ